MARRKSEPKTKSAGVKFPPHYPDPSKCIGKPVYTPSKFEGVDYCTVNYLGNPAYAFLIDRKHKTAFAGKVPFKP